MQFNARYINLLVVTCPIAQTSIYYALFQKVCINFAVQTSLLFDSDASERKIDSLPLVLLT